MKKCYLGICLGLLCLASCSTPEKKITYDENGREILEAYYNKDGKIVNGGPFYWAKKETTYDEAGNQIMVAYYRKNGKLRNQCPNLSDLEDYYDSHGKRLDDYEGWAQCVSTYDEDGHRTSECFYDEDGRPVQDFRNVYASWYATYDKDGHQTSLSFLRQRWQTGGGTLLSV